MSTRSFSLLVLLATAHAAHADAVADFTTGSTARVGAASVTLAGGTRSSTGSAVIKKKSGTLDLELQTEHFGVPIPITLHLRGTAIGGDWIEYAVDDAFLPEIDLGKEQRLSRVTGRLYLRALPLPGRLRQDVGNVRLVIADRSSLVAIGTWGEVEIPITRLDLLGGVVQPMLSAFVDPTEGKPVCSSEKEITSHVFEVSLTDVAKASGATVDVKGLRRGIHAPSIVVPAGRKTATVTAKIDPGFVGIVHMTAASGGAVRTIEVDIRPMADCQ